LSARERLRARTLGFLAAAGGVCEQAGDLAGALSCYERGIEVENLAEAMYQGAMRCLQRMGRTTEAMTLFRRLRQLLSVTLGVAPSADSEKLFHALRPGRPD
jgi:DNA-binding SARP family transcriptional activator